MGSNDEKTSIIAAELIESLFGDTIDETDRRINIDIAKSAIEKATESLRNTNVNLLRSLNAAQGDLTKSRAAHASELWSIVDSRTGEQATIASFLTKAGAQRQIEEWIERDKKGGRPDCHDLIPFLIPRLRAAHAIKSKEVCELALVRELRRKPAHASAKETGYSIGDKLVGPTPDET